MAKTEDTQQPEKVDDTLKEAARIIEAKNAQDVEHCKRLIQVALDETGCRLVVSVLLREGQVLPQMEIVKQ
jgi:hypothetical protein